jgi:hypothetical protein
MAIAMTMTTAAASIDYFDGDATDDDAEGGVWDGLDW